MANQAVYGVAANRNEAERLVQVLINANIPREDISFLSSQGEEWNELSADANAGRNWRTEDRLTDYPANMTAEERNRTNAKANKEKQGGLGHEKHSKAPEGATTGAATGGLIGGTLGLLAGIGALAIPGMGPFIAAGPIMGALSGLGLGGAIGGLLGALIGAGIPEYEAKRYENRIKQGGVLLSVRARNDDQAKQIKNLLEKNGAEDVTVSSEAAASKNNKKS